MYVLSTVGVQFSCLVLQCAVLEHANTVSEFTFD